MFHYGFGGMNVSLEKVEMNFCSYAWGLWWMSGNSALKFVIP
jgi:hypothetical protein